MASVAAAGGGGSTDGGSTSADGDGGNGRWSRFNRPSSCTSGTLSGECCRCMDCSLKLWSDRRFERHNASRLKEEFDAHIWEKKPSRKGAEKTLCYAEIWKILSDHSIYVLQRLKNTLHLRHRPAPPRPLTAEVAVQTDADDPTNKDQSIHWWMISTNNLHNKRSFSGPPKL